MEADSYKTIKKATAAVLFKDRNSKFFGYAFPVSTTQEVSQCIAALKKEHYQARHWCYAYRLGKRYEHYRANDDGEPANSAGQPIYGQLQSFELTNTLVVVVRYFGGTKLGVGGLINAYKTAAQMALVAAKVIEDTIKVEFKVQFGYELMNKVMRLIKDLELTIIDQQATTDCIMHLAVRETMAVQVKNTFQQLYPAKLFWPEKD